MDYKVLYEKTPPTRLFAAVAVPGIISMLVSSLYQVIDGAFVGQILGSEAFAALNLVMPLVIINFSIADLLGVGSAVPIAIKLVKKDEKGASNIFSGACLMIIGAGAVLGAIMFIFAEDFVRLMGAGEELVSIASQYLRVYALCSPVTTIIFAVDNYLRICGKVRYSMMVIIS
ncbi:MATE family efflux transporter [Lachnospiraceae bacterium 54-53]